MDAVRGYVARGAPLDGVGPIYYGQSPLAWAVMFGQLEVKF